MLVKVGEQRGPSLRAQLTCAFVSSTKYLRLLLNKNLKIIWYWAFSQNNTSMVFTLVVEILLFAIYDRKVSNLLNVVKAVLLN